MVIRSCKMEILSMAGLVLVLAILALKPQEMFTAEISDEEIKLIEEEEKGHEASYSHTRRVKRHDHSMFPPTRPTSERFGKALRFFGKELIRFTGHRVVTLREFTIDFWMKPEGGQQSPVSVLGLFDYCSLEASDRGWRIGLKEASPEKNLRIFFSLRAAPSNKSSILLSPLKVEPNVWMHVAATYDGRKMKLYINQANVAVSSHQKGHVFAKALMPDQCEALEAGGDIIANMYYRGTIDEVKLWSVAKSHKSISLGVFNNKQLDKNGFIFYEDFNGVSEKGVFQSSWVAVTKSLPETVKSTIPSDAHDMTISKPPCGTTVCDNPEVVRSYVNNTHLRDRKVLRFRIINVKEDDGRNPIVTPAQIKYQTEILNSSFHRYYNISWELHEVNVRNTSLRQRTVLYLCSPDKIGNMECNSECDFPITGQDGGDCIKTGGSKCDPSKRGNGKCDLECNRHDHLWDYGDCCNPKITLTNETCFDPASPYRAYISVREYKTLLNFSNHQYLNVYFAQCGDNCGDMFHGAATFPWEKTAHGILGGVIINPSHFGVEGHSNALIHEFGHMLGLWHVHHGVSEMKCSDECYEHFPSMELGDLCSDTNPTPRNNRCGDPSRKKTEDNCGKVYYKNTPFRNYMSYADDSCTNSFSQQQVARMHCYVDLIYQSWQPEITRPSFIPLPPRVTGDSPGRVAIAWIPPLGTGGENVKNMCHYCRENSVLHQYAVTAYSPISDKANGLWAAHQAIGAPDAGPCELSPKAWSPLLKKPPCSDCYIELGFQEAMIPSSLSIWVPWHSNNGISEIQLLFEDSTFKSLGNATAQCDTPLTMAIKTDKKVSKVRVYVRDPYTCIDAVQLTSSVLHPNCIRCKPMEYHVTRDPPFTSGKPVVVSQTKFIDQTVELGKTYQYSIQAVTSSGLKGSPSPVLTYTPKRGFCGDGHVDKETGEECDDGNVRDGDGCNVRCKKEDVFHCQGHPSLCYRHDGDGFCEDFERATSIKDCGFYTPEGFEDQWATNATANPDYQDEHCPESVVIGPPSRDLVCKPEKDSQAGTSWAPCVLRWNKDLDYWLDVMFERPVVPAAVVIYIASDGKTKYNERIETVEADLIDTSGNRHPSGSKPVNLSCKTNPAIIPVKHEMTKKFFYIQKVRIKFESYMVAVAGVALRSLTKVDPVAMANCRPDELFNPLTQKCHKYACVKPSCKPLVIKRAAVKCEGNEEGQRCTVTCAKGYLPRSSFKLLCLHGKWRGAVKKCLPVNCGMPKIPNAQPDCPKGTLFGAVCTFRCIQHAKRNGKDNSITCEDDSRWSVQRSFCVRTCAVPLVPLNSVPLSNSNTCINGKQKRFYPGMACKFRCKPGYRLVRDRHSSSRRTLKLRCTKEGKWASNSRCEPMTCKLPPLHILRWYNCSNGNAPGSVCTSVCPSEKLHQVKCGIDMEWSPKFIKCKAKSCDKLQAPGLNFVCDEYGLVETCKVKCLKPNHDAVVKGEEDNWDVTIKCNDKQLWVPDARMIICLPKCHTDIGDGFCDKPNNNKHCRWDGGDCCPSTTGLRRVRKMRDCEEECECKDPDAIENKYPGPGSGAGIGPDDDDDDDASPRDNSGGDNRSYKIETKQ